MTNSERKQKLEGHAGTAFPTMVAYYHCRLGFERAHGCQPFVPRLGNRCSRTQASARRRAPAWAITLRAFGPGAARELCSGRSERIGFEAESLACESLGWSESASVGPGCTRQAVVGRSERPACGSGRTWVL